MTREFTLASARDASDVLASFDPASFLLHFDIDDSPFLPGPDGVWGTPRQALETVPDSLVAHEFAHFVQGATTSAGVREFMLALDLFRVGHYLVSRAVELSRAHLQVPLLANAAPYLADHDFAEMYLAFCRLMSLASLYRGGIRVQPNSGDDGCQLEQRSDVGAFGIASTYPVYVFDMRRLVPGAGLVSLGYVHLAEGFAKAVEEIHRSESGEPGGRIRERGGVPDDLVAARDLLDPYYLARVIFARELEMHGVTGDTSIEEFCLLCELAMMVDPFVLRYQEPDTIVSSASRLEPGFPFDSNPFNTFMVLLEVYCSNYRDLPHIELHWTTQDACAFQSALLQAAGYQETLPELTAQLRRYTSDGLQRLSPSAAVPPEDLPSLYAYNFKLQQTWRAEGLGGGPVFLPLLTRGAAFLDLVEGAVPAIVVGASILSSAGAFRPGEGVGVDMVRFQMAHRVIIQILTGNGPCHLHMRRPRQCVVPPWALCEGLQSHPTTGAAACVREEAVRTVLTGDSPLLDWTS